VPAMGKGRAGRRLGDRQGQHGTLPMVRVAGQQPCLKLQCAEHLQLYPTIKLATHLPLAMSPPCPHPASSLPSKPAPQPSTKAPPTCTTHAATPPHLRQRLHQSVKRWLEKTGY